MQIMYHPRFTEVYAADPAAARGRLDAAIDAVSGVYPVLEPSPAADSDILLVHSEEHLQRIKAKDRVYDLALLAAGGAIKAAETACSGEPGFGLIRPPGHHASVDSCWGFCFFNNMAVAMEAMRRDGKVKTGVIVDIDLHFGDGTSGFYRNDPAVTYSHLNTISQLHAELDTLSTCDLLGISAGFDRHLQDWGGMLSTRDYRDIGRTIAGFTNRVCPGRVFALLEGGYNHQVLGESILALCRGLEEKSG